MAGFQMDSLITAAAPALATGDFPGALTLTRASLDEVALFRYNRSHCIWEIVPHNLCYCMTGKGLRLRRSISRKYCRDRFADRHGNLG